MLMANGFLADIRIPDAKIAGVSAGENFANKILRRSPSPNQTRPQGPTTRFTPKRYADFTINSPMILCHRGGRFRSGLSLNKAD